MWFYVNPVLHMRSPVMADLTQEARVWGYSKNPLVFYETMHSATSLIMNRMLKKKSIITGNSLLYSFFFLYLSKRDWIFFFSETLFMYVFCFLFLFWFFSGFGLTLFFLFIFERNWSLELVWFQRFQIDKCLPHRLNNVDVVMYSRKFPAHWLL